MMPQTQQRCNRDEIEGAVRLLLGYPLSPYVRHPTLFVDTSGVGDGVEDRGDSSFRSMGSAFTGDCSTFFTNWMKGRAIDVGSPGTIVLETAPLHLLVEHYLGLSTAHRGSLEHLPEVVKEATLVFKCYRPAGIHRSAIPLGERAVYLCATQTIQQHKAPAKCIFPQLFLPLFITTIETVDIRDDRPPSTSNKKRRKTAVTAVGVRHLKSCPASAPDLYVHCDGLETDGSPTAGSWPNLLQAESGILSSPASALLNPPTAPPPNTVVMPKYCGSIAELLSLNKELLSPEDFSRSFAADAAGHYCRVLSRQPITDRKLLASVLYLITKGLVQIHNLAHGCSHISGNNGPPEHLVGFSHNDVRLPNILLARDGNIGLVDFELAMPIVSQANGRHVLSDARRWHQADTGHVNEKFVGHAYLPPDGSPCDVWTLGIAALDLITGCHTFFSGDGALPADALRWSDGPTPMRAEANTRLQIIGQSGGTIEVGSPLDKFLAHCFTPDAGIRLQSLRHSQAESSCVPGCLCSHELFTTSLVSDNMEEEAMQCVTAHFFPPNKEDTTPHEEAAPETTMSPPPPLGANPNKQENILSL